MTVDFEDREDEGISDVSLKQPGVLIFAAIVAVEVAEATMPSADSSCRVDIDFRTLGRPDLPTAP